MKEDRFYFFTGITAALLFGLATPLSKVLLTTINPFLLAGILYLGGALGLAPFLSRKRIRTSQKPIYKILKYAKKERILIFGSVVFGGFLGPVLLLLGLVNIKAGSVAIWLNFELVATAILGVIFFKDTLEKNAIIGVGCMIAAGIIISFNEELTNILSILLVLGACICWGLDNQFTGMIEQITPTQATLIKGLAAGVANIILGLLVQGEKVILLNIFYALLLGALAYGLSIVLYIITAQNLGATRGQIIFSSSPIIGLVISVLLLDETFQATHAFAIILVIMGIFFSNRAKHGHMHTHMVLTHSHRHLHNDEHHQHDHKDVTSSDKRHNHEHTHHETTHEHPHYPDLHHRHEN